MRSFAAIALVAAAVLGAAATQAQPYIEPPALEAAVAAGDLPPVAARLPETPRVMALDGPGQSVGRHGGTWRMLAGRARDVRMMVVFGYARLVGYTPDFEIVPDILEAFEVEDQKKFTFRLRKGHRWSDGHPFTAEDFRYWWEDVANNRDLTPSGTPVDLIVDGHAPTFTVVDPYTVVYEWPVRNPTFLPRLAAASPLFLYRPAHYLRQFHATHQDADELARIVDETGRYNWASLHNSLDNLYQFDNPTLPTLQPWTNTSEPPTTRFLAARNPYFHRVDPQGRQLPYMDNIVMAISDPKLIPAKAGTGESDLQGRNLSFNDTSFLKRNEETEAIRVLLWDNAKASHMALAPNLNHGDPVWRTLFRDVRFRRALSLAIDRMEINQTFFFGLARGTGNGMLPASPLYDPARLATWNRFDLAQANRLLDEIGLTERDERGIRLLPDGRPMDIIVETAGEDEQQIDVLELIKESYRSIGIALYSRPSQRDVFRNRVYAGETLMSIWFGWENGISTPNSSPAELAPTDQASLQWPRWGQYYQNKGAAGEAIDLHEAQHLMDLYLAWLATDNFEHRTVIWREMLDIHADQLFLIGIVSGVPQPIVVNTALRNVPEKGIWNWDPGAQFGMYNPDTFWWAAE